MTIRPYRLLAAALALAISANASARVFGAPMPAGDAQPIAQVLSGTVAADGVARKFGGRITEVCQAKGCWLMLEGDGHAARVMMKDHAFAIPKDARGDAVVHGTLSVHELDAAQAAHLAADAGRSEPVASREFRIVADSVELRGE